MATYNVSRERLDATTAEVLRETAYPFIGPITQSTHTDLRVGPLMYDANKQRTAAIDVPEGSYSVWLYIAVVRSRLGEAYLDIRPAVLRLENNEWKFQRQTGNGGMRQGGGHVDPFQWDSWLASIADPIYKGVHARLKSEMYD